MKNNKVFNKSENLKLPNFLPKNWTFFSLIYLPNLPFFQPNNRLSNHDVETDESSISTGLKEKDESQTDIDHEYLQEDEWELKRRVNILFRNCGNEPPNKKALKYLNGASDKYKDYVMVNGPPVRPKAGQVFFINHVILQM